MALFCPNCGTQNDDTARFCKGCGTPLADAAGARAALDPPVGAPQADPAGRVLADDGLPAGEDLDGEPGGERLLWRGRPNFLLSPIKFFTQRYKLTNERLMVDQGFVSRRTEEIDLYRVTDVSVYQNVLERILGRGDILVQTADATAPQKRLSEVADPDRVKDILRQAARAERQRRRVLLREEF